MNREYPNTDIMGTVYRKCPECGTMNKNTDYCTHCGALVNMLERRRLEREQYAAKKELERQQKEPNKFTSFYERAKYHDNRIIRYLARFFYSIWVVVIVIGAILALIIAYIVA